MRRGNSVQDQLTDRVATDRHAHNNTANQNKRRQDMNEWLPFAWTALAVLVVGIVAWIAVAVTMYRKQSKRIQKMNEEFDLEWDSMTRRHRDGGMRGSL